MRLSNIRGSPMMDAIERCLDLLDAETMKTFVPQLQKTIRKALGLPSKVSQIFIHWLACSLYQTSGCGTMFYGSISFLFLSFFTYVKSFTEGFWSYILQAIVCTTAAPAVLSGTAF